MIRMYGAFFIVFFAMYFGIPSYRRLTGKEKWDIIKLLGYSALCAALSIGLLSLFVILF